MASTILYKFRSGTTFEPLPLPGTSARLFDVKRAIVRAKKLDSSTGGGSSLEFDLAIQNANTDEVYDDESMILPRGTRIVVRRVVLCVHRFVVDGQHVLFCFVCIVSIPGTAVVVLCCGVRFVFFWSFGGVGCKA